MGRFKGYKVKVHYLPKRGLVLEEMFFCVPVAIADCHSVDGAAHIVSKELKKMGIEGPFSYEIQEVN